MRIRLWVTPVVLAACLVAGGCTPAGLGGAGEGSSAAGATGGASTGAPAGTPSVTTGGGDVRPTAPATSATPLTPRQLCAAALPRRTLIAWGAGTVGGFRAYRYGTEGRRPPLANAFPGLGDDTPGAWCATRPAPQATAWWAIVPGREPKRAVTVVGSGEGRRLGEVSGPPAIP